MIGRLLELTVWKSEALTLHEITKFAENTTFTAFIVVRCKHQFRAVLTEWPSGLKL